MRDRGDGKYYPYHKPTLVVVPAEMKEKTNHDITRLLGHSYGVVAYAVMKKSMVPRSSNKKNTALLGRLGPTSIMIITYPELSRLGTSHDMNGVFDRVIVVDSHNLGRYKTSKQAAVLAALNAPLRLSVTELSRLDSAADLKDQLYFLGCGRPDLQSQSLQSVDGRRRTGGVDGRTAIKRRKVQGMVGGEDDLGDRSPYDAYSSLSSISSLKGFLSLDAFERCVPVCKVPHVHDWKPLTAF